jgi:hypothetical protein
MESARLAVTDERYDNASAISSCSNPAHSSNSEEPASRECGGATLEGPELIDLLVQKGAQVKNSN